MGVETTVYVLYLWHMMKIIRDDIDRYRVTSKMVVVACNGYNIKISVREGKCIW